MTRFVVPAAVAMVVGLLLGAAAVFGVTLMVATGTPPPVGGRPGVLGAEPRRDGNRT